MWAWRRRTPRWASRCWRRHVDVYDFWYWLSIQQTRASTSSALRRLLLEGKFLFNISFYGQWRRTGAVSEYHMVIWRHNVADVCNNNKQSRTNQASDRSSSLSRKSIVEAFEIWNWSSQQTTFSTHNDNDERMWKMRNILFMAVEYVSLVYKG